MRHNSETFKNLSCCGIFKRIDGIKDFIVMPLHFWAGHNSDSTTIFTTYKSRCTIHNELSQQALIRLKGVVAQWCNPLALQSDHSGGVGSIPGRTPLIEHHDKGSRTRLALSYFCDPAWR